MIPEFMEFERGRYRKKNNVVVIIESLTIDTYTPRKINGINLIPTWLSAKNVMWMSQPHLRLRLILKGTSIIEMKNKLYSLVSP